MELLGRLGAVVGISLVLTVLLLVLYQDDRSPLDTPVITQAVSAANQGTP